MLHTLYEIGVDLARFFFILAALYILIRMVDNSVAEYRFRKDMRQGGPGRFFGYMTVIRSANEALIGRRFGLKWENSIGQGRRNDIQLEDATVPKSAGMVYLARGRAYASALAGSRMLINGEQAQRSELLYDGDELGFGELTARIRLDESEEAGDE